MKIPANTLYDILIKYGVLTANLPVPHIKEDIYFFMSPIPVGDMTGRYLSSIDGVYWYRCKSEQDYGNSCRRYVIKEYKKIKKGEKLRSDIKNLIETNYDAS